MWPGGRDEIQPSKHKFCRCRLINGTLVHKTGKMLQPTSLLRNFLFFFCRLVLEESVKVTFLCRVEALHNKVNLKLVFEARSRLGSKTCEISVSMWDAKVQRDLRVKSGGDCWSRPDQRNQAREWGEREYKGWGQILLPGELPHLKHAEATGATEMCE